MKKFPASIPRKMFWSKDIGGKSDCPECGAKLESEHHTYVMAIREDGDIQPFVVGNDAGYFCAECPVVVLDHEAFTKFAIFGLGREGHGQFTVLGLVDLSAIPEEKSGIPLGEDGNPIPLVQFTNLQRHPEGNRSRARSRKKQKRSRRKRKRK